MKKQSNLAIMARLVKLVYPLTGFMLLAIILGILGFMSAISITVLGSVAVLDIMGFSVVLAATAACVLGIIFGILRGLFRYGEQTCNHYIAFKLLALIRDKVFAALRRLCPAKLEGHDRGNLISLITSDIEMLEVFYAHTLSPVAIGLVVSIIMCILISRFHIALGMIALIAYLTIGLFVPYIVSKLGGTTAKESQEKSADLSSFVLESLRGMEESIQYGGGEKRLNELDRQTKDLLEYEGKLKRDSSINTAISNTIIIVFDIIMLLSGSWLYSQGAIGFDAVIITVVTLMSSFGPVIALANLGSTLQSTMAAAGRVLNILDEQPQVEDITGNETIEFDSANVNEVSFSYGGQEILSSISADFPKNKIIGIVGKSGSGKSTLLKLLMRFWKVRSGDIKITDKSIEDINTENLRNMEGYVTQDTHLFHDTIENNLRLAKLDATKDEIVTACKKASVHDFIMSLAMGYETQVGELGDTLSGGERQRLGLARAFIHGAPFLLLDEPTSNLDSLNEAVILKALQENEDEQTVVLVSHRSSTVHIADIVYRIENRGMYYEKD